METMNLTQDIQLVRQDAEAYDNLLKDTLEVLEQAGIKTTYREDLAYGLALWLCDRLPVNSGIEGDWGENATLVIGVDLWNGHCITEQIKKAEQALATTCSQVTPLLVSPNDFISFLKIIEKEYAI